MVALAPAWPRTARSSLWLVGAAAVIVVGALPRLFAGGAGERSAAVLSVLVAACVLGAAALVATHRLAFGITAVAVLLLNIAALAPRAPAPYDDRQALYRTDQSITLHAAGSGTLLPLWVEARYGGAAPNFQLILDGTPLRCTWQRGVQRIGLPVRTAGDVRVQLGGSPARDGDFLIVYSSAAQVSIPLVDSTAGVTPCISSGG